MHAWLLAVGLLFVSLCAGRDPQTLDEAIRMANRNGISSRQMGNNIVDGYDMVLTKRQYDILYGKSKGRAEEGAVRLWTDGVIPYQIDWVFNEERINKIKQGMANWEQVTCIKFRPSTSSDTNSLFISSYEGCWSVLGMERVSRQPLSLQIDGCFWKGTVEHELGHAIGLVHEHQRPERDDHVFIQMENVNPRYKHNLVMYDNSVTKMGLEYDYNSLMHYGQNAFSIKPDQLGTVYAYNRQEGKYLNEMDDITGKALMTSFTDVKLVNAMYNCNAHCQNPPTCPADCFVDKNCKCFCKKDLPEVACVDAATDCSKRTDKDCWVKQSDNEIFCRHRCGLCAVNGTTLPPKYPILKKCENYLAYCYKLDCETFYMYCPKKCGLCKGGSLCEDNDPNCPILAEYGACRANSDYILANCTKSCGTCN